jgi:hypothetical protein
MAFITLSGTLLDPNGDLAVGDQIRFTHKSTTGETVQSAVSIITVNPAGTYSLPLQYGLVLVEYKDVRTQQFKNLGVATVNGTNPATSIPELLNALVPVSSAELIEFQAILADCVTAQTAAENAATTAEAFAYQLTTTDLIASTATFAAETNIPTSGFTTSGDGGNGSWKQNGITGQAPSQSPAQLGDALLNDGNGNQWSLITQDSKVLLSQLLDTPLAAANALQAALNSYTTIVIDIDITSGSVTIPSNRYIEINKKVTSKSVIGGALFTNNDHVVGNSNIFIYGKGEIDGKRVNQITGDNYLIHLVKVTTGMIKDIKVQGALLTTQPGNEGGIFGEECNNFVLEGVEAFSNTGCGILFRASDRCGSVRCVSHDNTTGSGIIFSEALYCYSDNDTVYNNDYSNLNLSGKGSTIINPKSYGSGFTGINIGETTLPANAGQDSVIIGGNSYGNTLDGLSVQGSDNVRVVGLNLYQNARHNIRIFDSSNDVKLMGIVSRDTNGTTSNGLQVDGGVGHFVGGGSEFYLNDLSGINFAGTSSNCHVDGSVKCYNNGQTTSGNSAGITLGATTSKITLEAECYDTQTGVETQESGIWNAGGDGHIIRNINLHNNKTNQYRETSGPTNTTIDKLRLSPAAFSGTFTAIASTSQVIPNTNARAPDKIQVSPRNAAAVTLGQPFVSSVILGVSFTVTYPSSAVGTESFAFEIN